MNNIKARLGNGWGTVIELLVIGFVVVAVPLIGWLSLTIIDQGKRMAAMESNRFTDDDGKEMALEISKIWQEISKMSRTTDLPPTWFVERVARIEEGNVETKRQLMTLERLMMKLDQKLDAKP